MELRLFGPIELWRGETRINPGPAKQRCVLAVLGVAAGTSIPVSAMVDRVWGVDQPRDVRNVLYTYIARLRRLLAPHGSSQGGILRRDPGGYVLDVAPEQVDIHRFQARLEEAGRTPDEEERARLLGEALRQWRGEPLSGINGVWADSVRARLEKLRMGAFENRFDIELRNGNLPASLIDELALAMDEFPAAERLAGLLMHALYRTGHAAEALTLFERVRRHLADEYGHEPAVELQTLHRQILRQDPALLGPAQVSGASVRLPRQLPIAPATFVGRQLELGTVVGALTSSERRTPPIVAICGPGGVGKSALAVCAAHSAAEHYPDGQLYIELQGSGPGVTALSPIEALSRLLRAFEASASAIPDTIEEAAAELRSQMADRRILMVLDNAADANQVIPLLPADASSGVLITSRSVLSALGDATHVRLAVLQPRDSATLLAQLDPAGRLAADRRLGRKLAELCGHLPLALRITAARMTSRPDWPLERFVQRLSDEQRRLDHLNDENLSVRSCFDGSYRALLQGTVEDKAAARAFKFLGLPDGPDISLPIAARLIDRPQADAEASLERLIDAQLLVSPALGQYRMHDLIRLYARERAEQEIPVADRWAALGRTWRCYLATTAAANQLLRPDRRETVVTPDLWDALTLVDREQAMAWLNTELANLLAAARHALNATRQSKVRGLQLTHALFTFMHLDARWADLRELNVVALKVARATGERSAEAQVLIDLGVMAWMTGDGDHATDLFREALEIQERTDDVYTRTLMNLGMVLSERGKHGEAVRHLERVLRQHRACGHRSGEAQALDALGQTNHRLGDTDAAIPQLTQSHGIYKDLNDLLGQAFTLRHLAQALLERGQVSEAQEALDQALAISRQCGDEKGAVRALVHLGTINRLNGDARRAVQLLEEALQISRRIGGRQEQGLALLRLGMALADLGAAQWAHECWSEALPIYERLGTPEADEVRRLLRTVAPSSSE